MLVKGGPGTGKTIIALNLMAALSGEGHNVRHATGSRDFTGNLKKIPGFRAGEQSSFFNNYVSTEYNLRRRTVSCDEAHRLRPNSNNRFQKVKSDKRQALTSYLQLEGRRLLHRRSAGGASGRGRQL